MLRNKFYYRMQLHQQPPGKEDARAIHLWGGSYFEQMNPLQIKSIQRKKCADIDTKGNKALNNEPTQTGFRRQVNINWEIVRIGK